MIIHLLVSDIIYEFVKNDPVVLTSIKISPISHKL